VRGVVTRSGNDLPPPPARSMDPSAGNKAGHRMSASAATNRLSTLTAKPPQAMKASLRSRLSALIALRKS
jgi:hypothetical protein